MPKRAKRTPTTTVETRAKTVIGQTGIFTAPARSGLPVNEQTAMGLSAMWAGVRTISQDVGCLDPILFREDSQGTRTKARRHPLVSLLADPNPEMTGLTLRETLQSHALLYGNAFAEIQRDGAGNPAALWPIHPLSCVVWRDSNTGQMSYRVTVNANGGPPGDIGEQIDIAPQDMLHIPGLSPDGSTGYRLLSIARESLGFSQAAMAYGSSFFRLGCRPSGTISSTTPLEAEDKEELRQSYHELHAGADNAGRLMFLPPGLAYTPMAATNEQTQYTDILTWSVYEVARLLLIPPPKLMSLDRATWGNITELNRAYLNDCLRPWLERWEHELERKLLTRAQRDGGWFIEFDTSTLLRADKPTRYAAYATALGNKAFMSINEVRQEENLPPVEGGDEILPPPPAPPAQPPAEGTQDQAPDQGEDTTQPTQEGEEDGDA